MRRTPQSSVLFPARLLFCLYAVCAGDLMCTYKQETDTSGNPRDYRAYKRTYDADECAQYCQSMSECVSAEFKEDRFACYLFYGPTTLRSSSNTVFIKKQCTEVTTLSTGIKEAATTAWSLGTKGTPSQMNQDVSSPNKTPGGKMKDVVRSSNSNAFPYRMSYKKRRMNPAFFHAFLKNDFTRTATTKHIYSTTVMTTSQASVNKPTTSGPRSTAVTSTHGDLSSIFTSAIPETTSALTGTITPNWTTSTYSTKSLQLTESITTLASTVPSTTRPPSGNINKNNINKNKNNNINILPLGNIINVSGLTNLVWTGNEGGTCFHHCSCAYKLRKGRCTYTVINYLCGVEQLCASKQRMRLRLQTYLQNERQFASQGQFIGQYLLQHQAVPYMEKHNHSMLDKFEKFLTAKNKDYKLSIVPASQNEGKTCSNPLNMWSKSGKKHRKSKMWMKMRNKLKSEQIRIMRRRMKRHRSGVITYTTRFNLSPSLRGHKVCFSQKHLPPPPKVLVVEFKSDESFSAKFLKVRSPRKICAVSQPDKKYPELYWPPALLIFTGTMFVKRKENMCKVFAATAPLLEFNVKYHQLMSTRHKYTIVYKSSPVLQEIKTPSRVFSARTGSSKRAFVYRFNLRLPKRYKKKNIFVNERLPTNKMQLIHPAPRNNKIH